MRKYRKTGDKLTFRGDDIPIISGDPGFLFDRNGKLTQEGENTAIAVVELGDTGKYYIIFPSERSITYALLLTDNRFKQIPENLIVEVTAAKSPSPSPKPSSPKAKSPSPSPKPSSPKLKTPSPSKSSPSPIIDEYYSPAASPYSSPKTPVLKPKKKKTDPKKKLERKNTKCKRTDKVIRVTWSRDRETKKIRYKEVCEVGGKSGRAVVRSRTIRRATYEQHIANKVPHRELPAKKVAVSRPAKKVVGPQRSDVAAFCDAYAKSYRDACNTNSGGRAEIACKFVGKSRKEYCTSTTKDGRARVRPYPLVKRTCAQIGERAKNYAINKGFTDPDGRKAASIKRCEAKRGKSARIGRYIASGRPARPLEGRQAPLISSFFS